MKHGFFSMLILLGLVACVSPSERFAQHADAYHFTGFSIKTDTFEHQVYANQAALHADYTQPLHIYLDGDGTPWEQQRWLAEDPTSRQPLILSLMHQDRAPALLLGRPCYHGFNKTTPCHPDYWTSHRYSDTVVNSLIAALKSTLTRFPFKQLVLIGYSGGGSLAILMTPHLSAVKTVVTITANLDVSAWSRHHGYPPLTDSLNPANLVLPGKIQQIHLAGLDDKQVPAWIVKAFADRQIDAHYLAF